jgi:WD40 repeat protein
MTRLACVTLLLIAGPLPGQGPTLRRTLEGHPDMVLHLAFSPDGKRLAASCAQGTVKLWDLKAPDGK